MKPQTVLVTGASGFVGFSVCRAVIGLGIHVIGTWRKTAPTFQHLGLEWVRADFSSASLPELQPHDFDAVIHTAAAIPGGSLSAEDAATCNRSIDNSIFRLAAARRTPLVYASSSSIYGERRDVITLSEGAMVFPSNPYSRAKLESEQMGAETADRASTRFVALRICAPYGPGQKARTVMQSFVENALKRKPLQYLGTGSREQAFTFVSDVADAFVLALRAGTGCFNIAGHPAVTMKELALLVAEQAGAPTDLVQPAGQPDLQEGLTARFEVKRAGRELGWSPKVSLRDGISRCLAARRTEKVA